VEIGAAAEPVPKREEPSTRQRREFLSREIVIAVWPHEILAFPCHPPRGECLATHERPKHLTLDSAAAVSN
jgi:hypothetical protein